MLRKYGVIPNRLLHHKISPRSIINKVFGFARQFQRRQKQRRNKVSETATTRKEQLRSVRPCITFILLSGNVRTLISRTKGHTTAHNTLTHTLSPKKYPDHRRLGTTRAQFDTQQFVLDISELHLIRFDRFSPVKPVNSSQVFGNPPCYIINNTILYEPF